MKGDYEATEQSIARAPGQDNYAEWLSAIKGNVEQSESNFDLAGPMTETILLGVLAQRFPGQKLQWDAENLQVKDRPELKPYIQRPYRDGWELTV